MGRKDRPEDLVLARILRRPLPHEGDDIHPRRELAEERISSLKIPEQPLVLAGLKLLFESFTIPLPRGAHDAWPFRPGVLRLLLANQGVKRLAG